MMGFEAEVARAHRERLLDEASLRRLVTLARGRPEVDRTITDGAPAPGPAGKRRRSLVPRPSTGMGTPTTRKA